MTEHFLRAIHTAREHAEQEAEENEPMQRLGRLAESIDLDADWELPSHTIDAPIKEESSYVNSLEELRLLFYRLGQTLGTMCNAFAEGAKQFAESKKQTEKDKENN